LRDRPVGSILTNILAKLEEIRRLLNGEEEEEED
jgi:hypothetical protein